jgi:hypothetical protein
MQLREKIEELIRSLPNADKLHPDYPALLAEFYTEDVERRARKFIAGHIAHGGDIRDRDLLAEIEAEVDDLGHYVAFEKWKRNRNNESNDFPQ